MIKKRLSPFGFTFIELLVVIAIIAVISGIGVVSYVTTNKKARDARRMSDVESIRSALELCRSEDGAYPSVIYPSVVCLDSTTLANTPSDPADNVDGSAVMYDYTSTTNTTYELTYTKEVPADTVVTVTNP